MNTENTAAKTITRQGVNTKTTDSAKSGIDAVSKGSIILMGAVSAIIGLWAVACFVGAMMSSSSPTGVFGGWFSSIIGM
ncbi:MAG: hypothetical protein KKE17_12065 [Proteobacteria bacterium]|nr:hypothetical protein [Pseudomonadota bacterium]MBU1710732.1 hypothetical protein [Pseudomonadota bacterium]